MRGRKTLPHGRNSSTGRPGNPFVQESRDFRRVERAAALGVLPREDPLIPPRPGAA
ncbi:hypothetical protein ACFSZS_10495 [Seohaeicola zhoushanensis]